mgnify:FL=1
MRPFCQPSSASGKSEQVLAAFGMMPSENTRQGHAHKCILKPAGYFLVRLKPDPLPWPG